MAASALSVQPQLAQAAAVCGSNASAVAHESADSMQARTRRRMRHGSPQPLVGLFMCSLVHEVLIAAHATAGGGALLRKASRPRTHGGARSTQLIANFRRG